jgi:hypothetical protein
MFANNGGPQSSGLSTMALTLVPCVGRIVLSYQWVMGRVRPRVGLEVLRYSVNRGVFEVSW